MLIRIIFHAADTEPSMLCLLSNVYDPSGLIGEAMLKRLNIENFTVFSKANFEFAAGLNVIVGENGTGKTHVLKLAYAITSVNKQRNSYIDGSLLKYEYIQKIINTFRIESLDGLIKRRSIRKLREALSGQSRRNNSKSLPFGAKVSLLFDDNDLDVDLTFSSGSLTLNLPKKWVENKTVFMPTRELLTIYPGFVSLYEGRYLEFDGTYNDTCILLGEPLLKEPQTELLSILETAMDGKVLLDNGRFYLSSDIGKIEMSLVAEGLRKLAMLARLIAVGALQKGGYLFWDEPEANLNPRLVKIVARVILQLANAGIQIFIATHSLFLLRELEVLQSSEKKPVPQRYFSLKQGADGVDVEQGNAIDDLQTLVVLDEELLQSDRYMALES
jgi:ABC-type lipoprotein export system ATPase subunit